MHSEVCVQHAAREFAQAELADHKYVMVLHDHRANPHVHISVRAESKHGRRLNPRKADLHRWRETLADKLRGYGVEAEATRGRTRNFELMWRVKAKEDGGCARARPRPSTEPQRRLRARRPCTPGATVRKSGPDIVVSPQLGSQDLGYERYGSLRRDDPLETDSRRSVCIG